MPDVFIAHYTEERERADALAASLDSRGVTAFVDHQVLKLGEDLAAQIARHVKQAAAVVVLVSDHGGAHRPWVPRELALASDEGVRVIAVRLGDTVVDDDKLHYDARATWRDPTHVPEDLVDNIVIAVRPHVLVIPGDSGRAAQFADKLAKTPLWRECEISRTDPNRAHTAFEHIVDQHASARVVVFVDLHDPTFEIKTYLKAIDRMRSRSKSPPAPRPVLRFKPIFLLLENRKINPEPPAELARYFRISPRANTKTLATDWRRVMDEWKQKPKIGH